MPNMNKIGNKVVDLAIIGLGMSLATIISTSCVIAGIEVLVEISALTSVLEQVLYALYGVSLLGLGIGLAIITINGIVTWIKDRRTKAKA